MPEYEWVLALGCVLAFCFGAGLGANDVANTFGSSVGAKALTYKQVRQSCSFVLADKVLSKLLHFYFICILFFEWDSNLGAAFELPSAWYLTVSGYINNVATNEKSPMFEKRAKTRISIR